MGAGTEDLDVVRAVHRLEEVAVDFAVFQAVGELGAGAVFVDEALDLVAPDDGRVLAFLVVGEVAGGAVEVELADVGGEDLVVAAFGEVFGDEGLELLADDGAFGHPEDEALTDVFVDVEEVEFAAEFAVVAGLGLFELFEVLAQLGFVFEGGAVDALDLRVGGVAFVVGAGDR